MRPVWKGHISFGLVMIPVVAYSGEEPQGDLDLDMIDGRDQSRIKYLRVNATTGKEVPWKSIVKGYEYEDGKYVILKPEDFRAAAATVAKGIEIVDFVDRDAISPVYFEKPYYIEPSKGGEKGYDLLRRVLQRTKRVGVARAVLHTRLHLAAIITQDDVLTLISMRFQHQVRKPSVVNTPGKDGSARATSREIEMAEKLIEGMTTDWEPSRYHDDYRDVLNKFIQQRIRLGGRKVVSIAAEEEQLPENYNIMDLLKKSVNSRSQHAEQKSRAERKRSLPSKLAHRKAS